MRRLADGRARVVGAGLVLALLIVLPLSGVDDSTLLTLSTILMWVALASNWNVIAGFTGYLDLGHAAFFGIGGYVAALVYSSFEWGIWVTAPIGAAAALVLSLLLGPAFLRLNGFFFAISTLGAFMVMREAAKITEIMAKETSGVILPAGLEQVNFYFLFLAAAVASVGIAWWLRRSRVGLSLQAIRENEAGAQARGINTSLAKLFAYSLPAALTGMIGGLWAYQATFVNAEIMFRDVVVLNLALMATLGGLGTVWGPVLGAALFVFISETLWATQGSLYLLVFGLVLVVVVLVMPNGLVRARPWRRASRSPVGDRG